ncbi:MAG: hypothetical protein P4M08_15315 [Oligoflexia bacterium]|nr:hypothetical protein [Oligoflexia bacterium]
MRRIILPLMTIGALFCCAAYAASDPIAITLDSLSNLAGNGAIEACGTGVAQDGTQPVLITVRHADSYYTTLTAPNGKWCLVFKRWTFDGRIDVSGTTLRNPSEMNFRTFSAPSRANE